MKKMYVAVVIVLSLIICILIAIIIGLSVSKSKISDNLKNTEQMANDELNETISATNVEEQVRPTANIFMRQYYKSCGHTITEKYGVPEEIVNMNKAEVKRYYYDWNLEKFSDKELVITKDNPGLCEEHFVVKDVEGVVIVYNYDNEKNEKLYLTTQISTKYLPKEDMAKLQQGINIIGKDNLYELLQDYE
ncbi:MAG: BofC C-terminal domain-containing protein [Clostridia bacterium]|nr:BofC C-terminal domain-containing protein [Clostridia bacterium]